MIKNIIFDFDGTLADTKKQIIFCFQETIKLLHLPHCLPEACAATIGLPLDEAFVQLIGADEALAKTCVAAYEGVFRKTKDNFPTTLFDGVEDTIRELHQLHITTTIASSRQSVSIQRMLADRQLAHFFPYILGNDNVTLHKPHPEPVLKTLRELNLHAEETLVVGDTWYDVAMAKAANVRAIGVSFGIGTKERLLQEGAYRVIDHFGDLLSCLA